MSPVFFCLFFCFFVAGCSSNVFGPTDLQIFRYHSEKHLASLHTYISRLYKKNPCYQPDPVNRQKRMSQMFNGAVILDRYAHRHSDEILTEAFSENPDEPDRVYLLGLGLVKSIQEAYGMESDDFMVSGLQIPLKRLQRLHFNLSQVNWRVKTYKDANGRLLFQSNEVGEDGYINMGYEVVMTEMLTRIEDDIYLRGGLPGKYIFRMSTLFVSLFI